MYNGNIHFTETEQFVTNTKGNFIIKFSGIWENSTEYGITYKFIYCNICDPKMTDDVPEHMYLTAPPPSTPPPPLPSHFAASPTPQNFDFPTSSTPKNFEHAFLRSF